jgi:hypothetical protein
MSADELIVAGWVLVTATPRAPVLGSSLPNEFLTISDCIQEELPRPLGWDWFLDVIEAEQARRETAPHARPITIAMAATDAAAFIEQFPEEWQVGSFDLLRQHVPLEAGASVLGFEVVGAEYPLGFHSWHCHGYADDVADALGIRTNAHGLLASSGEAHAVLDWMLSRPPHQAPKEVPWGVIALASMDQDGR